MSIRSPARSVLRAALFPAAVLAVYFLAREPLHLRSVSYGWTNVAMHFVGGFAVAHFAAALLLPLAAALPRPRRALLLAVGIIALTATLAVSWEFFECVVARVLHVRGPSRGGDSLRDIAAGIAGGLAYVSSSLVLRAGASRPAA